MLKNKVIVIIGGTAGIGLSAAQAFGQNGAKVVVVGNRSEDHDLAKAYLKEQAAVILADAKESETAEYAINQAVELYGDFHGLYHVAGGSGRKMGDGTLHELSDIGWEETLNLNLTSVMNSNRAAVRWFLEHKQRGTVLNLGSILAFSPSPKYFNTIAYATSKAAIEGFTKSAAACYAKSNIRLNVLAPGLVDTPMAERASNNKEIQSFVRSKQALDGGRNGNTEDLIGAALYFMSDYSKFTTGQVLHVSGGWEITDGQFISNS